jgi:hypothetical protein
VRRVYIGVSHQLVYISNPPTHSLTRFNRVVYFAGLVQADAPRSGEIMSYGNNAVIDLQITENVICTSVNIKVQTRCVLP